MMEFAVFGTNDYVNYIRNNNNVFYCFDTILQTPDQVYHYHLVRHLCNTYFLYLFISIVKFGVFTTIMIEYDGIYIYEGMAEACIMKHRRSLILCMLLPRF